MRWINVIRLKGNTKTANPLLEATGTGKDVLTSHKDSLLAALQYFRKHSMDNKAANLIQAGKICRENKKFLEILQKNCQTESTTKSFSFSHFTSFTSFIFPLKMFPLYCLFFFMNEKNMMYFKFIIGQHINLEWWSLLSYKKFLLLKSSICYDCWLAAICNCQRNPMDQIRWASWKNFFCVNRWFSSWEHIYEICLGM